MDSDVHREATRVLIADDHVGYREGMARLISDHPDLTVVAVAVDGEEALAMIATLQPDVALLDVRMPGRTGLDVCRAVQASGVSPRTRIVLITGTPDPVLSERAAEAGAVAVLGKETSPLEICERLLAAAVAGSRRGAS
jgi:DNA-binding NarL/FixJ family response regulator